MLRISANRWMAFVLTLCLFTTCFFLVAAGLSPAARADAYSSYLPADDETPFAPSVGDPDVPTGPGDGRAGKFVVSRSGSNQLVSQSGVGPTVEGAAPASVVMDRVHLFLLSLRSFYLRF